MSILYIICFGHSVGAVAVLKRARRVYFGLPREFIVFWVLGASCGVFDGLPGEISVSFFRCDLLPLPLPLLVSALQLFRRVYPSEKQRAERIDCEMSAKFFCGTTHRLSGI